MVKHIILIQPEQGVTGVGVGQWNKTLAAFSGCCRQTIELDHDTNTYRCPGCHLPAETQPMVNPTLRLGERVGLDVMCRRFIEQWTGLMGVEVNIEWTEE